ncbi:MAG: T9SS type A sorting domain-containing protein, partial [Bacteroidales bacterium]
LIIYPNPASEETQITINDDGISDHSMSERSSSYYVNIFDLQGSVVYSDKVTSNVFILSVSGLTNGTYSVVATDNKTIWQGALIVSH